MRYSLAQQGASLRTIIQKHTTCHQSKQTSVSLQIPRGKHYSKGVEGINREKALDFKYRITPTETRDKEIPWAVSSVDQYPYKTSCALSYCFFIKLHFHRTMQYLTQKNNHIRKHLFEVEHEVTQIKICINTNPHWVITQGRNKGQINKGTNWQLCTVGHNCVMYTTKSLQNNHLRSTEDQATFNVVL